MPWKLGDPDEPTVMVYIRMPLSMKTWLDERRGGLSKYVRKLVSVKMANRRRARGAGETETQAAE